MFAGQFALDAGEAGVPREAVPDSWVELPDAIEALRRDLAEAWLDGRNATVRFRVEPVELTIQVGVTRTGKGSAGIKWHIIALGGERSRETTATQTLKLRLTPEFFDAEGRRLADVEQLIFDLDQSVAEADELGDKSE
jgi:hypothetical protein